MLRIEGLLNDTKQKHLEVLELQHREKEMSEFLTNNKEQIKQIRKDIYNLNDTDKKLLVEGMLVDKAIVNYQSFDENYPEDGEGPIVDFRLKFNPEILQRFVDEGKIVLGKNSSHDPTAFVPRGGLGHHHDPFCCRETGQERITANSKALPGSSSYHF